MPYQTIVGHALACHLIRTHAEACPTTPMEVRETHNAAEFLRLAEKFLMEHEAENNLILGQAMRLARGETAGTAAVTFYAGEDGGRGVGGGGSDSRAARGGGRGRGDAGALAAG